MTVTTAEHDLEMSSDRQRGLVVDFGAQYAQLIARRVRELNVYSEIVPASITAERIAEMAPAAIVLSGGPKSVHVPGAPMLEPGALTLEEAATREQEGRPWYMAERQP